MSKIVIALGGNALQANPKDTSANSQLNTAKDTAKYLVDLVEEGHNIIIAHGNGPQVGQIVSTYESSSSNVMMPFPECGAMSQGYIGYHLQQAIKIELMKRNINKDVVTLITEVVVDEKDENFNNPSKPIGSFFTKEEAEKISDEKGYVFKEDAGRGWRRVVASPLPVRIVEENSIKALVDAGHIVITVGGGGIPVIEKDEYLKGVDAVIDKDFASEKLAEILDADKLLILTAVEKVYINYGKPEEKSLDKVTVELMDKYMEEGHFAPGSMLPKVKAAIKFAASKEDRETVITSLDKVKEGLEGITGTSISL
ncbi:carbamate kinase [Clostridium algidicarnis]|uniref:Carbamate kinase n=2 Tax=Clostridium algidicarnis TaxID=37659 RepID=A0A2S6G135_9CLOT|nr:carbamate kinase [Clostridium algidicarnis]MBB6630554.1 carbamate kinase [Clostridium algidicarnis]MBB6696299.1 carbamate kinase [Clostridium algidicarnis]MBU3193518.1 carbamate kinase [Clostridium algidicarnis]MBU3203076.1 carbamate kinase [Clostridium algidicarnis]MBU3205626.1 carbamate kinase [Clostridium algidicarnis]